MDFQTLEWRPSIGDPTWVGWITVLGYAVGAALAVQVAMAQPGTVPGSWRKLWLGVAAVLALLGINKQLDLQTLFMQVGRLVAQSQGWYEKRRTFQMWFVAGVFGSVAVVFGWFTFRFRSFWAAHRLLIAGVALLVTFVVVRAVSFHHFDVLLSTELLGVRVHRLLELAGISLVIVAAIQELLSSSTSSRELSRSRRIRHNG